MTPSKRTSSFLLRVWLEPGAGEGADGGVRGYLRNLQTGEEQYIGSAAALTTVVRSHVLTGVARLPEGQSAEIEEGGPIAGRGSA